MNQPYIPPFVQSMIDQTDALNRDNATKLLDLYTAHALETHAGEPSPCGQALVSLEAVAASRHTLASLVAYLVERVYVLEHPGVGGQR